MLCENPYVMYAGGRQAVGCGGCLPCRVHRRRAWTTRLLLERYSHEQNSFVTLTYSDDHVPVDGSLEPHLLQDFFKRLRKRLAPDRIRFYAVGEYGDESERPHYHVAIFGLSMLDRAPVEESWAIDNEPIGFVHLGELNQASSQYLVKYTLKRMTHRQDKRLNGRHPEFSRSSNRPGIGAAAAEAFAEKLRGQDLEDVPFQVRIGGKLWPLGRYLRNRMRKELFDEEKVQRLKTKWRDIQDDKMQVLLCGPELLDGLPDRLARLVAKEESQRRASMIARHNIYETKGKL